MASSISYSVGFVVLMLASMLVTAQKNGTNPCRGILDCTVCVVTPFTISPGNIMTCVFHHTSEGPVCTSDPFPSEQTSEISRNAEDCAKNDPVITTTVNPNATTAAPTTIPTTTATSTTSATTPIPPSNATTPTTPSTPVTTPTTTPTPPNSTTPAVPTVPTTPSPVPSNGTTPIPGPQTTPNPNEPKGGMSVASFFGGIVFTLGVSAVGYLVWRFYKVRMDRNYHTFANPTF